MVSIINKCSEVVSLLLSSIYPALLTRNLNSFFHGYKWWSSTEPGSKSSLPVHDTFPDTSQIVVCKKSILIPSSLSVLKPAIHNRKRKRNRNRKRKIGKGILPRRTKYIRLQELDDSPSSLFIYRSIKQSSEHIISYPNIYHIISHISYQGNLWYFLFFNS